jgi:putative transposase
MFENNHNDVSIKKQCYLVSISRSTFYYHAKGVNEPYSDEYKKVGEMAYLKYPIYGYRRRNQFLSSKEFENCENKARNAMKKYGLRAIYPNPKLSVKNADHDVYTYLLKDHGIKHSNLVLRHGYHVHNAKLCIRISDGYYRHL